MVQLQLYGHTGEPASLPENQASETRGSSAMTKQVGKMTQRHTTNLQQPQISSCPSCSLPWACFVTIYIVHIAALVTLLFQTECVLKYCPLGTLRSAQGNKKKPARRGTREVTLLSWLLLPSALPSGPLSPPCATQDSCPPSDQNSLRRPNAAPKRHTLVRENPDRNLDS